MIEPPAIVAIRRFLAIIQEGTPPSTAELARALDELALAMHDAPDGDPADEDTQPPERDYHSLRAGLDARFPGLNSYQVVCPIGPETVVTASAHDDLADIVGDLNEVVWRYENVGADDAHWHLHFLFLHHWGVHLRELSFYLHMTLREHDLD